MKKYKLIILLIVSNVIFGQEYLLKNEEIIFSFDAKNKKKLVLAKDKGEKYIVCRYGTIDKIEFEFPEKTEESWGRFSYSYFSRNGNIENSIIFNHNGFKYTIFDCYYPDNRNKFSIGMSIEDDEHKIAYLRGKIKTQKGKLVVDDLSKNMHSVNK